MQSLNTAQQWLVLLGVDEHRLALGHRNDRNASPTKKGPGRKHGRGEEVRHQRPVKSRPPLGFERHTNPEKRERRQVIAAFGGTRQWKRMPKAHRPVIDVA